MHRKSVVIRLQVTDRLGHSGDLACTTYQGFGCWPSRRQPQSMSCTLQHATAAYSRCRHVFPDQWADFIKVQKGSAERVKPLLVQLQQQGDSWQAAWRMDASALERRTHA